MVDIEFIVKFRTLETNNSYEMDFCKTSILSLPSESDEIRIEQIETGILELKRLEGRTVNLYELYMLAETIDCYRTKRFAEYNAHIYVEDLKEMKDLINAAFDIDKYVLISEFPYKFSEAEARQVYLSEHDGCASVEELNENGTIAYLENACKKYPVLTTPYGYILQVHKETQEIYDGTHLKRLSFEQNEMCTLELIDYDEQFVMSIALPTSEACIKAVLKKGKVNDITELNYEYINLGYDEKLWNSMQQILKNDIYVVNKFLMELYRLTLKTDIDKQGMKYAEQESA